MLDSSSNTKDEVEAFETMAKKERDGHSYKGDSGPS